MDWELIWQKIQAYAISFYHFAMTEGESNFMLVNHNIVQNSYLPDETRHFFMGSFVVMVLLAILACDSFKATAPIEGIKEWKSKISIIKVVIFSAAVFSLHTFYKILIALSGRIFHAYASIAALDCLGSYINPISLMIYAFAVSTITFRKGWLQAMFLGWAIFLTPAAMSLSSFTYEHIILYSVAGAFGILGAICYKRLSPYASCFVMYIGYFIAKFFIIYYSDEIFLLTADSWPGKIAQYMACMQMDVILCVLLMLILLGYKQTTTEKADRELKSDIILSAITVALMVGTIFFSNTTEEGPIQFSNNSVNVIYDFFDNTSEAADEAAKIDRLKLFLREYRRVN